MPQQVSSLKTGEKFKDTPIGKIPVDWEVAALSSVSGINMGQSPPSQDCGEEKIGLPFYQGNAEFGSKYPVPQKRCENPKKIAQKGDILISVRAPVGEINIAPHECCIGRGLAAIRAKKIHDSFLYYSLLFHRHSLQKIAQGSTFKAINRDEISDLLIFSPPISEQKKIADILVTVDEAIEKTAQIIEKTKVVKRGLMQNLLTRGIGHKKFKKTEIGEIPADWDVVELGALISLKHGYAFKSKYFSDLGPILLTPGNFREDGGLYFNEGNLKRYSGIYPSEFSFSPNDLVMVMTDLSPFCKIFGNPAFVPSNETILHNQRIGKVIFRTNKIEKRYLYLFFLSELFKKEIKATATGTTVRHTAPERIYKIKIGLPPIKEQQIISSILFCLDEELERETYHKDHLEFMKRGLMQVLLTGQVRVNV